MKKEENKEIYLLIWRVFAFCLSVLALLCVFALAVLALFFPKPYASVLQSVGLNQIALNVYEDIYKNSQDVNDGYVFLTESIYANNDKYVVLAFEALSQDDDFLDLLSSIDNQNQSRFGFGVGQAMLCNERDYLMGHYVYSLSKVKGFDVAFSVAGSDLDDILANLNTINKDKSFVFFDLVNAVEDNQDVQYFDLDIQLKFLQFADKCSNFAENFISLNSYSLTDYAESLESVIRSIEVYVALEKIREKGNLLVLDKAEIGIRLDYLNDLFNKIVEKVVV